MINDEDLNDILERVVHDHGYDFKHYSRASLKRRVNRLMSMDHLESKEELLLKLGSDEGYLKRFVEELTVNVTEMFRDPWFFKALRAHVLPTLGTKPFIRIWHAGCSTGEEVFSMAIILHEAGLLSKSILYATDLNPEVLNQARSGCIALHLMKLYSQNYIECGGRQDFSSYYTANYGQAKMNPEIMSKIVFSTHNLVSDRSFNLFDLILCRNVLIYFDRDLQERVFALFNESLSVPGFLALGARETIRFSDIKPYYEQVEKEKIWKKIRPSRVT
jgi:chemotaxis protein methyltransferase CheR